jgi:hypothetical protein
LDDLAAAANASAVVPQDMERTFDVSRTYDPAYAGPTTMTGAFSFSDETEIWQDPLGGVPRVVFAERFAWDNELNRIWKSVWNIQNSTPTSGLTIGYPYGNDGWDTGSEAVGTAENNVATWWTYAPTPSPGSTDEMVISEGPNCFTQVAFTSGTYVKAYDHIRAIFSKEQDAFDILSGLFTPETWSIGDHAHHDAFAGVGGWVETTIDTASIGAVGTTGLYGYFEIEYTNPSSSAADPTNYLLDFHDGGSTGNIYTKRDGNSWFMWFDADGIGVDGWRKDHYIYYASGSLLPDTGTVHVRHYVVDAGWVFAGMTIRGGIYQNVASSSSGILTGEQVIHPRNESIRAALHVTNDPHLVYNNTADPQDILNFIDLDAKLSNPGFGTRHVDTIIRSMLRVSPTTDELDAYPVPNPDQDAPPAAYDMTTDLNSIIDAAVDNVIYDSWIQECLASVTLRPGTRWLVELHSTNIDIIRRMNRRLLEDCYPTQLRRIPATKTFPENEVLSLSLAGTATGTATWDTVTLVAGTLYCTNENAKLLYIGVGLPQWCSNTFLDYQMPNVQSNGRVMSFPSDSLDAQRSFQTLMSPVPSNYPVIHMKWFGTLVNVSYRDKTPDASLRGYVPYWATDENHRWTTYPSRSLPTPTLSYDYNTFGPILIGLDFTQGWNIEWSCGNRELTVYVSATDFVADPPVPGTYIFSDPKGFFSLHPSLANPDIYVFELSDGSFIDASPYLGSNIVITLYNPTATGQRYQTIISYFKPTSGEQPALPDPAFFPKMEPATQSGFMNGGIFYPGGDSFRFGPSAVPFSLDTNAGRQFPCPQRGQHVRELVIQRMPIRNSSGCYVIPTTSDEKVIWIGLMAGAGVVAGAIYGSYPGDWMDFQTFTIPADTNEYRVSVSYPVLEGCPLAYWVEETVHGTEDDEEFSIFASVEFQPAVNNTFVPKREIIENIEGQPTSLLQGSFSGPPYLSNTMLFHDNLNNTRDNFESTRDGNANTVKPPIQARNLNAFYDFLTHL